MATMQRVYVWEFPVRMYHWVNAFCVVVLAATGLLIGKPLLPYFGGEASFNYSFGWVRFTHFAAAYVFFFNFLFRLYWGFVGNYHARWRQFLPLPGKHRSKMREAIQVLKQDVLFTRGKPIESVGHNALASWTYFLTFLAFLFQSATGFGMYAAMSDARIPKLFAWVVPLMGGDFATRQWHHIMTWFFVLFSMIHVYLVFYHDYVEGRGVISSMAGGWKFVERDER